MKWTDAPDAVLDAVNTHLGPVSAADDITAGSRADLTTVVTTPAGRVFVKAVRGIDFRMRLLRNETLIGAATLPDLVPAVLAHVDLDDEDGTPWLVVMTEHVDGRPASLAPGSPDLDIVAGVLQDLAAVEAPPGVWSLARRWAATDWWQRCAEHSPGVVAGWDLDEMTRLSAPVPALADGDRLVHSDLHPDQILITAAGPRVIDWGYVSAGAGWVDTALITLRLIIAGHDPAAAEAWARGLPTGRDADPATLDAFAAYLGGWWTHLAATRPGVAAQSARNWAEWRHCQRTTVAAG
ncbi:hypothetical protein [Alloactinosynnema sp. L-07]|uniref:phosphotransferase family protein n=1 Tax=Alloactinosynnema sp. L-07 TaxID=1653480 RepID=UPI00065EF2A1|nr:phosphotransferase [Alloactinosynnema sp. L-07]CRK57088.1 hypothetical protein [Alloactinosynnema sp. L-07]